jgi:hypothetical protein
LKFFGGCLEGEKIVFDCFYESIAVVILKIFPELVAAFRKPAVTVKMFRKSLMMLEKVTEFRNFFHSFMYEESFGQIFRINKCTHMLDASRNVIF